VTTHPDSFLMLDRTDQFAPGPGAWRRIKPISRRRISGSVQPVTPRSLAPIPFPPERRDLPDQAT
jgi:hypothetical protein